MKATILGALAIGAFLAGCSTTETTYVDRPVASAATGGDMVVNPNAQIPFVQYGGIRDWRTENDHELYAQASDRRWYKVELLGPCIGLEFANGVRFLPSDSAGTFDRFSSIVVDGQRCKVDRVEALQGEPDVANHPHPRYRSNAS
jgi:hypothetical protein